MGEELFKRKEYNSWDEAFRGLAPVIRQQSVRVASYTQVLFAQGCGASFGKNTAEGAERMKRKYADFAYKCGLYHQLGKAVMPVEYQVCSPDFTNEQMTAFRKYPIEGKELVIKLQEPKKKVFGRKKSGSEENAPENITWLMLREVCEQHMERYDGTGYPYGLSGNDISVVAQIVGLAKELDRIATETVSENPFEVAYETLVNEAGKAFSSELIAVFKVAKDKCEDVFNKYIHYSKAIVKTIPLVDKRAERPLGLRYSPMKNKMTYEAIPWFKGILDKPDESEGIKNLESMLVRTGHITDVYFYFLYEVADTILRMKNCKIDTNGILVQIPAGFYEGASKLSKFEQLFTDQPIEAKKLMVTVPEQVLSMEDPQVKENLKEYSENGLCLVLDDFHPDKTTIEEIQELGVKYVRITSELESEQDNIKCMNTLNNAGITVLNGHDDKIMLTEEDIITNGLSNQ